MFLRKKLYPSRENMKAASYLNACLCGKILKEDSLHMNLNLNALDTFCTEYFLYLIAFLNKEITWKDSQYDISVTSNLSTAVELCLVGK